MKMSVFFRFIDGVLYVPFIPGSKELKWDQMRKDDEKRRKLKENQKKLEDQKNSQK